MWLSTSGLRGRHKTQNAEQFEHGPTGLVTIPTGSNGMHRLSCSYYFYKKEPIEINVAATETLCKSECFSLKD